MIKIYHNPRCRKSRAGLEYLKEKGFEPVVCEYLKNPLTKTEFSVLLQKLNKQPSELVRTQEDYFKKNLKGKQFNEDEWLQILTETPSLIQRPIVERGHKAVIGDPVEEIEGLIGAK